MVLDPTIANWALVPVGKKEAMWQLLSGTFFLPRGTTEKVKYYATKMLGEAFRRWKSHLNTEYVQKGRTPFSEFGDITPAQWEEFVRQKTTEEALALSLKSRTSTEQHTQSPSWARWVPKEGGPMAASKRGGNSCRAAGSLRKIG